MTLFDGTKAGLADTVAVEGAKLAVVWAGARASTHTFRGDAPFQYQEVFPTERSHSMFTMHLACSGFEVSKAAKRRFEPLYTARSSIGASVHHQGDQ